jgi:organic hydroperoxide reductase OsmC/OhrA
MPGKTHRYATTLRWTGNRGTGTSGYKDYARTHEIVATGKPIIPGSSDPAFRGDADRYNPEDLLIGAISACHMLWYLHLCATAKVVVVAYEDDADGQMVEDADGGRFVSATIRPRVTLAPGSNVEKARAFHHDAHVKCFIANSLNFPVAVEPSFATA